jgi:hypothetical protein
MLDTEVVTMFPQIPATLPPAITKGHDVAEFVMFRDMAEHEPLRAASACVAVGAHR